MVDFAQLFRRKPSVPVVEEEKVRVHIDEPLAVTRLANSLTGLLTGLAKQGKGPIILCIGTDRSTGDSLGPLTGWRLSTLLRNGDVPVYGTVDEPVHANNLEEQIAIIKKKYPQHPIVAVDACLGQIANVGTVLLAPGPIKPGAAVNKALPEVGDVSISGIVNVSGFMEFQVLQNTRLSLVLKMSQVIANSTYLALRDLKEQRSPLPAAPFDKYH